MKPTETLLRTTAPDGAVVVLTRHDGTYRLSLDGQELMSSRQHRSERELARLACEVLQGKPAPRVLIGGLGFGYTLRAALDLLPPGAEVVVAELFGFLVEAHTKELGELAGRPLADPRVRVVVGDVQALLKAGEHFDAILLDVDNGPWAFTQPANASLYSRSGLARLKHCLRTSGVVAIWSAEPSPEFEERLRAAGFTVRAERVPAREGGRVKHTVFLARWWSG